MGWRSLVVGIQRFTPFVMTFVAFVAFHTTSHRIENAPTFANLGTIFGESLAHVDKYAIHYPDVNAFFAKRSVFPVAAVAFAWFKLGLVAFVLDRLVLFLASVAVKLVATLAFFPTLAHTICSLLVVWYYQALR